MNQSPELGSQQDFNKFVGSTAIAANTINQNPSEFDDMKKRLTADADLAQETANDEKTAVFKDLARYENNATAPEGVMDQGLIVPATAAELQPQTPVPENESQQLIKQ